MLGASEAIAAIEAAVGRGAATVTEYTDHGRHWLAFDIYPDDHLRHRDKLFAAICDLDTTPPTMRIEGQDGPPATIWRPEVTRLLAARDAIAAQPRREGWTSPYLRVGTAFRYGAIIGR